MVGMRLAILKRLRRRNSLKLKTPSAIRQLADGGKGVFNLCLYCTKLAPISKTK